MRVIGGSARGRRLKRPTGGVRPTSDLLRGVIFDMLDAMGADYSRVLDLYAGTGALGIEALSRGDGRCDFVEKDRAAAALVQENLALADLADRGRVHMLPVERAPERLQGPYTLILADPPYADSAALEAVRRVAESALPAAGAVLVLEHSKRQPPPETLGPLQLIRTRRHGDSVVSIYRQVRQQQDPGWPKDPASDQNTRR